jgi:hypothetical protein
MRFILEKKGKRFEYAVPEGNMIVGRDRKSDISIDDTNVSRHHMTVMRRVDEVTIRDLGSRNGTFVNNERVTEAKLRAGDIVRMGNLSLFFTDGSPGVEIPENLGATNDAAIQPAGGTAPTPGEGTAVPQAPPQDPAAPPGEEPGPLPDDGTGLQAPAPGEETLMDRARAFYLENKILVLGGLGGLVALLVVVSLAKNLSDGKGREGKTRRMPIATYDRYLDDGIAYFDRWISNRSDKTALSQAKLHFRKIKKYHPERYTANIMLDLLGLWETADANYDTFDWGKCKRLLSEIANHPNSTPNAKNFGQARIQWWRNEKVTRTYLASGDKAEMEERWEDALKWFKKLEDYPRSRAYKLRKDRVSTLTKKIYMEYKTKGDIQRKNEEWERAIEAYTKARAFATEEEKAELDSLIDGCKDLIEEGRVFDEVLELESQSRIEEALAKLAQISESSRNQIQAERIRKRLMKKKLLVDGRNLYESGQAQAAIRKLSDPLVFSEVEAVSIRETAQKILDALEKGDRILSETKLKIENMDKPSKLTGFESAREEWFKVQRMAGVPGEYKKQAETRLGDLTNEKIGRMYYDKAQVLIREEKLGTARDFIELAREYDLSLGSKQIRLWREDARKKYNIAINLTDSDKVRAKELFQWIVDALRPGDSEYYEKARKELAKLNR